MSLSLKNLALCTRHRRTRRRTRRLRRIKQCGGDRIGPCERGGGCGLLYHLWQGGNRPITNDSRCLNTMSIFDGKDGSSHPSFQSRPSCWSHFHFDKTFFSKVEPPTTKLDQQTTNIYASMSLLYTDSLAYMPTSHRGRWTNIEST